MCEPTTLATLSSALTIATTAAKGVAGIQQQQAQNRATEASYASARKSALDQYAQIDLRRDQERSAASDRLQGLQKEAMQARATARVAAGERGVSGLSVDAILADVTRQGLGNRANLRTNFANLSDQFEQEKKGVRAGTQNQINQQPGIATPNYLGTALEIGAAGAQGYLEWKERQPVKIDLEQPGRSGRGK